MKRFLISYFLFLLSPTAIAQKEIQLSPTHWWTGMKWNKVQVMVHGENVADNFPMIKMGPNGIKLATGVSLLKIHRVENPNYIFLDLVIDKSAKPGKFSFPFIKNVKIEYELKSRQPGNGTTYAQGVTSKDLMYLIMPDRFSNGDPSNDRIPGMRDQTLNRDTVFNRHGGDLKGIQNHLDYLSGLGVTALWLNPVIENDMPNRTEHGYAFTDHFKIDRRLGGEQAYKDLINAMHSRGMKMVQDAVYNHVGRFHFTVQDMPMKNWLNQWPEYTNTTYKDQAIFDPYVSKIDRKKMTDGWFTPEMPDLNHKNPFVVNYLIQHALWTVQEFGIDGWRIDTYSYNDLDFMNRCNKALMDEFPKITMFGETWVHGVPNQSFFTENNYNIPFKSNLQATTDFQTLWGITDALTKDFEWTEGVNKLYTTLAQDFVYKDPTRQVIFLDNHDKDRFFSVVNEDVTKYKTALTWLLTSRGIPQLYYGAETATPGKTHPNDGYVRLDFPGGWPGDKINKFRQEGRTKRDDSIYNHLTTLANYRKKSSALTTGKFMQFVPEDGVYVYFRYDDKQTVMVVMNTAKKEMKINVDRYKERLNNFSKMKDVLSGVVTQLTDFSVESYDSKVFELSR